MPDVIRLCMLFNDLHGMPHLTSPYRVCIPRVMMTLPQLTPSDHVGFTRAMMACHNRRRPSVYVV